MINRSLNSLKTKKPQQLNSFKFLMQSMQREKQNININNDQLQQTSKRKFKKTSLLFFDQEDSLQLPARNNLSSNRKDFTIEQFFAKISTYIGIATTISEDQQIKNSSLIHQLKLIGQEIQKIIQKVRGDKIEFSTNFDLRKSLKGCQIISKKQQMSFVKKIKELENQNNRLNQLIAKHEEANIKMHIKINESSSNDIENYKSQLQNSYKAYKALQQKIKQYEKKVNSLEKEKYILFKQKQKKQKIIEYLEIKNIKKNKDEKSNRDDSRDIKKQIKQKMQKQDKRLLNQNQLKKIIDEQNQELQNLYKKIQGIISSYDQRQKKIKEQNKELRIKYRDKKQNLKNSLDSETYFHLLIQADAIQKLIASNPNL